MIDFRNLPLWQLRAREGLSNVTSSMLDKYEDLIAFMQGRGVMLESFQYLLEQGSLVVIGQSREGFPVFTMTEEMAEVYPEIYDVFVAHNFKMFRAQWW